MLNQSHPQHAKPPRPARNSAHLESACRDIENDLRRIYAGEFDQAHEACANLVRLSERSLPKSYVDLDAAIVADVAGSNEVKRVLPQVIDQHLPGAALHDQVDEPAVIDSTWLCDHHVVIVEWDYTRHFGDPDGLTVTARPVAT